MIAVGEVKWFYNDKGFGFVRVPGVDEDIFFHHQVIDMSGYRTAAAGQDVQVKYRRTTDGLKASKVRVLDGGRIKDPKFCCQCGESLFRRDLETARITGACKECAPNLMDGSRRHDG